MSPNSRKLKSLLASSMAAAAFDCVKCTNTHTLLSLSRVDFISSKIHFMFTRNFYKWMCLKIAFAMVDYYFKKGMFMDTRVMGRRSHDHSRRWLKVRPKAMNALGSLSLSRSLCFRHQKWPTITRCKRRRNTNALVPRSIPSIVQVERSEPLGNLTTFSYARNNTFATVHSAR